MKVKITTESIRANMRVEGTDYVQNRFAHESQKQIDWSDSSDRKWLMNHLHHCMNNGKRVSLEPDNAFTLFHANRS